MQETALPTMAQPFKYREHQFQTRNPGFLKHLADSEYCKVFIDLINTKKECPTWYGIQI